MPHCHLPLQSGDNEVLRTMKRQYTVESFIEIYYRLRQIPGMAVTTDIIVGFPGETREQFERTIAVVEVLRFDGAYMFAYSPRPGTPAGESENQLPREEKMLRLNALIALQNKITCAINESEVDGVYEVLVEGPSEKDPNMMKGLTRHGKTMHFRCDKSCTGQLVHVRAEVAQQWGFYGKLQ
jgi:tRNA-2-methylthio-N6-dimethylallyladenosine synthase